MLPSTKFTVGDKIKLAPDVKWVRTFTENGSYTRIPASTLKGCVGRVDHTYRANVTGRYCYAVNFAKTDKGRTTPLYLKFFSYQLELVDYGPSHKRMIEEHNKQLAQDIKKEVAVHLKDIENAGYRVFGAYGVDHRDFSHMHQLYDGYAYHGIIEVDGKKKFFRVTLVEDCPLYNVRIRIKTIDDLKAAIKEYFPVDSSDNHYYDMYNVQIRDIYRVDAFVYGIIKEYGFKVGGRYGFVEHVMSYQRQIGDNKKVFLDVDTKNFKLCASVGEFSWTEADFKMWDVESVKNALSQVMMVPILTEVGPGFDLLVSIPSQSDTADVKSADIGLLSTFGAKPDDIRSKLESAKANIEKLLATL